MPDDLIPFGTTLYCSFCGKARDNVKILIAGPHAYICDECIVVCFGTIAEKGGLNTASITEEMRLPVEGHLVEEILGVARELTENEDEQEAKIIKLKGLSTTLEAIKTARIT